MSKNIAIVLAGGEGLRFLSEETHQPKQYTLLLNKPIIYYSLITFLQHDFIDFVLPVINIKHETVYNNFVKKYNLLNHPKLMNYVIGGNERKHSVYNALKMLNNLTLSISKVLIHDSARPFVSKKLINSVLKSTSETQGCIPILHVNDSLKEIQSNNFVTNELSRQYSVKTQTPQAFPFRLLLDAYHKYINTEVTDDAGIFLKGNLKIFTVLGNILNQKITTKDNLKYLEYMSTVVEQRVGQGFDIHAFSSNSKRKLMLGGIDIPYIKGLEGHSDADVVLHALVDAILGALCKGDIGEYFPPHEKQWKDTNSKIFLLKVNQLLKEDNATINNIDITILCEEPKLGNYKKVIASSIANMLDINTEKVNVKATTTEMLGFVGRKEGIAASVTVSLFISKFINTSLDY